LRYDISQYAEQTRKKGALMAATDKRQYIPARGGMGDLPFVRRLVSF
jgi:hypothetical protein